MSQPISGMTVAMSMLQTDTFPFQRGAAPPNFQATIDIALAAAPGEFRAMQAGGGQVLVSSIGNVLITDGAGQSIQLTQSGGASLGLAGAAGNVGLVGGIAGTFLLGQGAGGMTILAQIVTLFSLGGASCIVSFTPLAPANWAFNPPDMAAAIDRIAAALVLRTVGGPIP